MTLFGFVIGTTLVNTLFVFDLYCTKFQQRKSLWGATMVTIRQSSVLLSIMPLYTLLSLWITGLIFGNFITLIQLIISTVFWVWLVVLYINSTIWYYKLNLKDSVEDEH